MSEDDAVALQSLNSLRDAAQHYMIELSEEHLYVYAQSGLTLFDRLAKNVLHRPLKDEIPQRAMPVCAQPPTDLGALFDAEFADIKRMAAPRSRKRLDARAKLRSMAVLQSSLDGKKSQSSDAELNQFLTRINGGEDWRDIFPGVATLRIAKEGTGSGLALRITRNQGEAVRLVPEGAPDATVVAVRKINELDFYNLGLTDMARKLYRIVPTKLLWLIQKEGMQADPEYFKTIRIGKTIYKRYSWKCYEELKKKLEQIDLDDTYANWKASLPS